MRNLGIGLVAASLLLASFGGASAVIPAEDVVVSGRKIVVKDNANASKRRAVAVSKDPTLNLTGLDPSVGGATFYLVSPSSGQQSSTFDLPASGWSSKNGKFTYVDKSLVSGPVKKAKLKNGLLKIVLKGDQIDFPVLGVAPLGEVGGVLALSTTVGHVHICFLFPGDEGTVKRDSPVKGIYKAVRAEAPDFCPSLIP